MWDVEFTDQFGDWWNTLAEGEQAAIDAAVQALEASGPSLGRPLVDTLQGTKLKNLKELRPGTLRILFAFDPRRMAILLCGGDKQGEWVAFYQRAIPQAEQLYAEHLAEIEKEQQP